LLGTELPKTIANLSTQYSGYYALAHLGDICRQITVTGKTRIEDSVGGEIKGVGKIY